MARLKIIILETVRTKYRVAFWIDTKSGNAGFHADPAKASAWTGAQPEDITALRDGSVQEKVDSFDFPDGTTLAQAQAELVKVHTRFQAAEDTDTKYQNTSIAYDGTNWVRG